MIITRLVMKNFKRFKNQEIQFHEGITGIVGNNGTGKSSIVEAIFFALFGVSGGGIASEHIVSSFAGPSEKCEVSLEFQVGAESYKISRTFRKGKTLLHDVILTCGVGIRASGVSGVETEIRRVLGMGPNDFRNTIYAAQKDLLTLLDLTPGKRKEWFLRALGIDYLNTGSQKILKEAADAKENELRQLEGELLGLPHQDEGELQQVKAAITGLKDEIEKSQAHITTNEQRRGEQEVGLKAFNDRKAEHTRLFGLSTTLSEEYAALDTRHTILQGKIITVDPAEYQQLEGTIAGIPDARTETETFRKKAADLDAIAKERQGINAEIRDLDTRSAKETLTLDALDTDEKKAIELADLIRKELGITDDGTLIELTIATHREDLLQATASLKAQSMANAREHDKILLNRQTILDAGAEGICPLCRQKLGDHFENVQEEYNFLFGKNAEEANTIDTALAQKIEETLHLDAQKTALATIKMLAEKVRGRKFIEDELARIQTRLTTIQARNSELFDQQAAIAYDEEAHNACRERLLELEKAQARYIELGKQIAQQAGIAAQIAEVQAQLVSKEAALTETDRAITALQFDPNVGTKLQEDLNGILQVATALNRQVATATERIRGCQENITQIEQAVQRAGDIRQRIGLYKEDVEILKLTRTAIADYVVYIMQVVRSRIEAEVSQIIGEITGGRYDQVMLDEDFNLYVRENGNQYAVDRFSGGEQDDIAVALRIALSRYLAELHQVHESTLLIFDEIFGSQDEERRSNLLTALRSQESRFPQIILISHISEIQGEFANTLAVQMGQDQSSTIKEVG
jgi:exonuclease SbcC